MGLAPAFGLGSLLRPEAVQFTDSDAHAWQTPVQGSSDLPALVQEVPASIKMCASMEGPGPYGSEYDCTDMITLNSYCCEAHCSLPDSLPPLGGHCKACNAQEVGPHHLCRQNPSDSGAPGAFCLYLAELPGLHKYPFCYFLLCHAYC